MLPIHELKSEISHGKISPLYIFFGEEIGIMNLYIENIANRLNVKAQRIDALKEIASTMSTKGFINKNRLYVIRDDNQYMKQPDVWSRVMNGELQGNSVVILLYTKLDQRTKFFKEHEEHITEFIRLPEEVLAKYIYNEIELEKPFSTRLARDCGCDYTRVMLECDKLVHLKAGMDVDDISEIYKYAMANQLINISMGDVIFDFISAVVSKNTEVAYKLKLYLDSQNIMGTLTLFYMNFKAIMIVKSGHSENSNLGSYQIYHAKEHINRYRISELVRILGVIRFIEKGIKTGQIAQEIALDYLMVNVL